MSTSYIESTTLTSITCAQCGILFAMPQDTNDRFKESHKTFYCPIGHHQYYGSKSEKEKLRDELTREKHNTEQARANANWHSEHRERAEKKAAAYKGVATRTKNRVAHGVCPCCKRSFQNIKRHMSCKHPHYVRSSKDEVIDKRRKKR